jgi:hypothetical protein
MSPVGRYDSVSAFHSSYALCRLRHHFEDQVVGPWRRQALDGVWHPLPADRSMSPWWLAQTARSGPNATPMGARPGAPRLSTRCSSHPSRAAAGPSDNSNPRAAPRLFPPT